jgi:type II secretory pathway component PulM
LVPSTPRILEADQNGELHIGSLSGNATARIDSWPHIARGQRVWFRLEGTNADDSAYEKSLWLGTTHSVSPGWHDQGYGETSIRLDELQALRDGSQLTLEFKASFNKSTDEAHATLFRLRTYTIRAAFDAPAPSVKQATGSSPTQQLNPMEAKDALTVVIPEYGTQPGDQVRVTWAGTAAGGSHTTDWQTLPINREIDMPVPVIAFNLGRSVTVTYNVTRNSGEKQPSAALTLAVGTLAESALEPSRPRILQAADDGNGGELDVGSLSGNATARIDNWPHIAPGQRVWFRLEGTYANDSAYEKPIWLGTTAAVSPEWYEQQYVETPIRLDELQALRDGSQLTLEFKASFNKSTDEAHATLFRLRTYTIRAAFDASAPSVKQATGSSPTQQLNPMEAKDVLTVVIPDYGIQPGDQVSVAWTGTAGGGSHTTEWQTLPSNREIDMPVPVIAFNLGRSVTVTYTVTRNSGEKPPSAALTLAVGTLAESALEPSRPRILQAADDGNGGELHIGSLSGNAMARIDSWPHIASGQSVWFRLEGTNADDSAYEKSLWLGTTHSVSPGWHDQGYGEAGIRLDELQALRDGSQLTLEFKASFNKSTDEAHATLFRLRTYTIRAAFDASAPSVKQATGSSPTQQLNPMEAKDVLTVVIPDYGIQPGDQVSVAWTGTAGGGSHTTEWQTLPSNREIDMPVPVIAFNLGRSVTVTYTVKRNSGEKPPSAALTLNVLPIEPFLEQPRIPQVTFDSSSQTEVLDLRTFNGNAQVIVQPWPLIAVNQRVWLRCDVNTPLGNPTTWWLSQDLPVESGEVSAGLSKEIARILLGSGMRPNSPITVGLQVTFDGSSDRERAVNFPPRSYLVWHG